MASINMKYTPATPDSAIPATAGPAPGAAPKKERFINRADKIVFALSYEASSGELSNWLVNFEDSMAAAFPDSEEDKVRPTEIFGKLNSQWQSEIEKDTFKGLTWEQAKKKIRDRHAVRFLPQTIQVQMMMMVRGGDDLRDWVTLQVKIPYGEP